ncbi:LytR/AlgR family response regulator transcription factor [Pseudoalteromonas peptidolytica]|uniref:LytR/AlgR family response regulator transcription factor n=1 Tax=Pseudoalteromonas peptidolytica TaxID=61150 RepID=UPI00298D88AA|nr:LytTR family DNA-binding domain-containing protein [Pseudoalteromonas peptidolytica]MDW7550990.1 LytTR family DNA-binding domain-containing protein [Pseudoalteromonas peptidolytica]
MAQQYKAVIADDEAILRAHLQAKLAETWPELIIIAQAANGEEALALSETLQPDVLFLDINMPAKTGLEVAALINQQATHRPLIVFVTAYDEYAISAFEHQALDYVLKPISNDRLQKTIERIKQRLLQASSQQVQLQQLLASLTPPTANDYLKWIRANKGGSIHMLDINAVDYFIADNKYTEVSSAGEKYLIKTPISELETRLAAEHFWRIHRNCIVRVSQIDKVERDELGHVHVHLKNEPTQLAVSRKYQSLFKQM